jgi:hypothetical protein
MKPVARLLFGAALACAALAAPSAGRAQTCEGDCNDDNTVLVDELVTSVAAAFNGDDGAACALDRDGDGDVLVYELITAVRRALEGCPYPRDEALRLNQIQVVGSHNSYHIRPAPPILAALAELNPTDLSEPLEYDHPELAIQFDEQGVRQLEIDVFVDPAGGLYSTPYGLELTTGVPNASLPELAAPGYKVLHIQDVDFQSVCSTLVECLEDVKAWSHAHPLHMPIMILIEAKDDILPDFGFNFVTPLPIGAAELDVLDAEIRSVFPPEHLITPDDVRGTRTTLAEAVQTDGWPTLGESRGKILFCFDNGGRYLNDYVRGHPSLQGRVMFTSSSANSPEAAFMKLNDAIGDFDEIQAAVADGFIVRTRADSDTRQSRNNDPTTREAALASGAQWVSTDYPVPDLNFSDYVVVMPDGTPARCNPISAPAECAPADIENPEHLAR